MSFQQIKTNMKHNACGFKQALKSQKVSDYQLPKIVQLKYTFIVIALLAIAFFNLADTPVEMWVKHDMPQVINTIFQQITKIGKAEYILEICGLILLIRLVIRIDSVTEKARKIWRKLTLYSLFILGSVAISGIIGQILKCIIGRARPKLFEQYGSFYFQHFHAPGYDFASMPSGHSATIGSICFALMFIAPRFKYLWIVLALLVAGSRIIVGAHYPSDVTFGLALGAYTSAYMYVWMKNRDLIQ